MQYNMLDPSLSFAIMSLSIECGDFLTQSLKIEKNKTAVSKLKSKFPDIIKNISEICNKLPFPSSFDKLIEASKNNVENKEMDQWVEKSNLFLFSISLTILSNRILTSTRDYQFIEGDSKKFTETVLTELLYFCKTCIKVSEILNVDIDDIKKSILH